MKNFPSALIKQRSTKDGLGSDLGSTLKNIGTKALSSLFGGGKKSVDPKTMNSNFERGYTRPELETLIDESNLLEDKDATDAIQNRINSQVNLKYNTENGFPKKTVDVTFEDPFKFSSSIFSVINNYNYILGASAPSIYENIGNLQGDDKKGTFQMSIIENAIAPSLFNPYAGVNITGLTENIPLVDREFEKLSGETESGAKDIADKSQNSKIQLNSVLWSRTKDLSDCSIKKLVELSQGPEPELGLATYRYIDFMYCKDLGKIPNNRLITLRRFPGPVGDNIFKNAHPSKNHKLLKGVPDIGRLITWFDNEDNKLEDICKYNYRATWKEFTSEIQQQQTGTKDDGLVSKLANFFSPQNNKLVGEGFSGNTGALAWGANLLHIPTIPFGDNGNGASQYYGLETLTNYDKNRIYEPQDKIWSTHKYEGRLEFNQEITLTFRYQLRSYSNINPRAALLDLLANIQTVTYRRGSFWGGEIKMYGPQANSSVFDKAEVWLEKGEKSLGGIWDRIKEGNYDISTLQNFIEGAINKAGEVLNQAANTAQGMVDGNSKEVSEKAKTVASESAKKLEEYNKKYKWTSAIKGMIKNQLGRPAIYALNSLLTGEEVGPWHLTIGNPRNPIMSIGNLIMDSPAEIQHYGPLGIDDFPTELRVTVTLKHGRPRDSVEIQKMYTRGEGSIYKPMNLINTSKYWKNDFAFGDVVTTDEVLKKTLSSI